MEAWTPSRRRHRKCRSQSPAALFRSEVRGFRSYVYVFLISSLILFSFAAAWLVNVTDKHHQRELMAEESPGPKYNVHSLASNGGKNGAPKYSFAPPSPETKTRLPNVDSPRKGHRESWMSVINRNGVLIMPSSPAPPRTGAAHDAARAASEAARAEEVAGTSNNSPRSRSAMHGSVFGNEHRFGVRQQQLQQEKAETPRKGVASTRVQFVSTKHTRENMGTLLR